MLVPRLHFTDAARDKLGRRNISIEQARQVAVNRPVVVRNPRGAVSGSRLMVGVDDGGRLLTLVLEPLASGAWNVRTGWPATRAQIVVYRRRRR